MHGARANHHLLSLEAAVPLQELEVLVLLEQVLLVNIVKNVWFVARPAHLCPVTHKIRVHPTTVLPGALALAHSLPVLLLLIQTGIGSVLVIEAWHGPNGTRPGLGAFLVIWLLKCAQVGPPVLTRGLLGLDDRVVVEFLLLERLTTWNLEFWSRKSIDGKSLETPLSA